MALLVKLHNSYRVVGLGTRRDCLWQGIAARVPDAHARALALADRGAEETE